MGKILFKSFYTVNEYVLGFLPSFYGLQLIILSRQLCCNQISLKNFLRYTEKFIKDIPKETQHEILKTLSEEYLRKKIKLTQHCLARLIGRFGDQLIDIVMERIRYAIKAASAYKRSRSAVKTSMFVTVVMDNVDHTLITLYPCKYYA